jgi:hypothetical protein
VKRLAAPRPIHARAGRANRVRPLGPCVAALAVAACASEDGGAALRLALDAPAAAVAGPVTVTAIPSQPVRRVDFALDGAEFDADLTPPFTATLVSPAVPDGAHVVSARATAADGRVATAEATVILDNASPAVTVAAPTEPRVLPPGEVTVRLDATDPAGLGTGRLRLDGGAPIALDASLSATIQLPPNTRFPSDHMVAWELDDAAGNRATGELPLSFTHERAAHRFEVFGHVVPVPAPGGGLLVSAGQRILAFDADDRSRWDVDTGWQVGELAPMADGGALAVLFDEERLPGAFVRRLGPDGATVFAAPNVAEAVYGYVVPEPSGEVLAARIEPDAVPVRGSLVRVGADGGEATLATFPDGWLARRILRWDDGAFAVVLAEVAGGALPRLAAYGAGGEPRWSTELPAGNHAVVQGWPLGPDLAVLAFFDLDTEAITLRAFGPAGEAWWLAEGPGETFESARIRDGALWLASTLEHVHAAIRRVEPDGSIGRTFAFDESLWYWEVADDGGLLVELAESLVRFAATGEERWRFALPASDEVTVLASAALLGDGAVWAVAPGTDFPARVFALDAAGVESFRQELPAGPVLGVLAAPDDGRLLVLRHRGFNADEAEVIDLHVVMR